MENLPDLLIASTTTVTMASSYLGKPTRISVGGFQNLYTTTTIINFATTGLNALDTGTIALNTLYYIYAVKSSGGVAGLVASLAAPSVGPSGYTAWREIGRCRTLSSAATLATITNRVGGTSSLSLGGSLGQTFTPGSSTQGLGTLAALGLFYERIGDRIHVQGRLTTGTTTAVEARLGLLSGMTIGNYTNTTVVGDWWLNTSLITVQKRGTISTFAGYSYVNFGFDDYTLTVSPFAASNGSSLFGAGVVVSVDFWVYISEFAGLYT